MSEEGRGRTRLQPGTCMHVMMWMTCVGSGLKVDCQAGCRSRSVLQEKVDKEGAIGQECAGRRSQLRLLHWEGSKSESRDIIFRALFYI